MFKISLAITYLVIILLSPNRIVASIDLLSDNFDDNRIDPSKWISFEDGGPTVTEVNSRLEFTIPADSADIFIFQADIASTCVLRGNYDIQVEYQLLEWPAKNGVRMGLSTASDNSFADITRVSWGPNDPSFSYNPATPEVYLTNPNRVVIGTDDEFGKLRLGRIGDISTSYYFDSTTEEWVPMSSGIYTTDDVHLYLAAWSHLVPLPKIAFGDQEVRVAFDNLVVQGKKICKGRFTPANPPLF